MVNFPISIAYHTSLLLAIPAQHGNKSERDAKAASLAALLLNSQKMGWRRKSEKCSGLVLKEKNSKSR